MSLGELCEYLLGEGLGLLPPCLHLIELLEYSFVRGVCEVVVDDRLHPVMRVFVRDQGGDYLLVGLVAGLKDDFPVLEAVVFFFDVVRHDDELLPEGIVRCGEPLRLCRVCSFHFLHVLR